MGSEDRYSIRDVSVSYIVILRPILGFRVSRGDGLSLSVCEHGNQEDLQRKSKNYSIYMFLFPVHFFGFV
jgi:hypothetical protein